ncbi:MAG: ATP-binding protein [Bacteroidetes bacterium]|nr:ATP-binding protein [Bacteroidota bacterium]
MIAVFSGMSKSEKLSALQKLARSTQKNIFRVDLSQIISVYIGETEKNLGKIFNQAAGNDWILFFDEADALFGKRTDVKDSHDRYANKEVVYLLQQLENFKGMAVFASHNTNNFPEVLKSRCESIITSNRYKKPKI